MKALKLLRRYVRNRMGKVWLLLALALLKTFLGGTGFLLLIPALNSLNLPLTASDTQLSLLISFIPGTGGLSQILVLFLLLMIGMAGINFYNAILQEEVEQSVITALRKEIYQLTLGATWQYVSGIHRADYVRIQADEVEGVSSLLSYLMQLATLLITIVVYVLLCLYLSASITFIAASLSIALLLLSYPVQKLLMASGARHLSASEQLYRKTGEQITGIRAIKTSANMPQHEKEFGHAVDNLKNEERRYAWLSSLTQMIYSTIAALAFCLLAWISTQWLETDIAVLVVMSLIFARLMPQISQLQTLLQRVAFMMPSLSAVADYVFQAQTHQETKDGQTPVYGETFSRGISLEQVYFRYAKSNEDCLTNLTVHFPANAFTLVTGNSGIGKSTLADIISGLSLPTRGEVKAGDCLLSAQNYQSWRRQVTYVPQTPFLIDASIRDNLCLLTDHQPSDAVLEKILAQASASFVLALPDGLDTRAGEDGNRFSSGEQQRLLLARALLEETPVLILDESTSNLDESAEGEFLEVLQQLKQTRTIIMISHKQYLEDVADQTIIINEDGNR